MTSSDENIWYYVSDETERHGPVSVRELGILATQGKITPRTLLWSQGYPEWFPAEKIKDLLNAAGTGDTEKSLPPPAQPTPAQLPPQDLKPRKGSFVFPRLVATGVVSVVIGTIFSAILYGLQQTAWFALPLSIAVFFLGILSALAAYRKERYQLLGTRLVCHRGGLFSDEATEFEIRNITHVKLKLPWLRHKLFRVGDVIVKTAGSATPMVMRSIHDPETIYSDMRGRMKSNGYDLSQRELLHEEKPAMVGVIGECLALLVGTAFFSVFMLAGIFQDFNIPANPLAVKGGIAAILFVTLISVVLRFLDLRRRTYRVFNDVVVYDEGFLTRENAFIPYENIADSNTRRTLVDQILGLYDVHVSCQGSSSEIKFRRLKNGIRLSNAIDQLVSAAGKKPDPAKLSPGDGSSGTIKKLPRRAEPEVLPDRSLRMAEYRINATRLLVPQMLLLPLFPIWILAMLKSLILLSSTRYFVRPGSLRHSYKFLRVDDREFSYDKITGVAIRKNLWDKWFGTMTIKFWSIGSGKSLEFAHIHSGQIDLPALMRQVGIPQSADEPFNVLARFGILIWLRAHIWIIFASAVYSIGIFVIAILSEEPLAYALLVNPVLIIALGLIHGKLYYTRQRLRFHDHHIEAEQGVIAKSTYYARYKNVKRTTATRYPGGEEGSLKIYVAGEEEAYSQQTQGKGKKPMMKQCSFTSGMLPDAGNTAAMLDDILSGRMDPSPAASTARPSGILVESPRSVGNALTALLLASILLFPLVALLPLTIPITILRVKRWHYRIEDFRIVESHGVFFKKETSVLLDRVDSLQQSQGMLNKIFRNGKVTIMTAGSSKPDLSIIDSPAYLLMYGEIRKHSDS